MTGKSEPFHVVTCATFTINNLSERDLVSLRSKVVYGLFSHCDLCDARVRACIVSFWISIPNTHTHSESWLR